MTVQLSRGATGHAGLRYRFCWMVHVSTSQPAIEISEGGTSPSSFVASHCLSRTPLNRSISCTSCTVATVAGMRPMPIPQVPVPFGRTLRYTSTSSLVIKNLHPSDSLWGIDDSNTLLASIASEAARNCTSVALAAASTEPFAVASAASIDLPAASLAAATAAADCIPCGAVAYAAGAGAEVAAAADGKRGCAYEVDLPIGACTLPFWGGASHSRLHTWPAVRPSKQQQT